MKYGRGKSNGDERGSKRQWSEDEAKSECDWRVAEVRIGLMKGVESESEVREMVTTTICRISIPLRESEFHHNPVTADLANCWSLS